jgi:hypothetical protein
MGTISITVSSAVTIGSAKGNLEFLDLGTSATSLTVNAGGALVIGELMSFDQGSFQGKSITVNQPVSATASLNLRANGGAIAATSSALLSAFNLNLSQTAAGKTLNVDSPHVSLGAPVPVPGFPALFLPGGFTIVDSAGGTITLSGGLPVSFVNFTSSGNGAVATVNSIQTNAGGLTVTTTGNGASVAAGASSVIATSGGGINFFVRGAGNSIDIGSGSTLTTKSGSVVLENDNDSTGTITIETNATIHASGTAKGVGQVDITIDPVPTNPILGTIPTPNPVLITSGAGNITFSVAGVPAGSITTSGTNVLNAAGRNIIFNSTGNIIQLNGGDTIIADPPVSAASSSSSVSLPAVSAYLGAASGYSAASIANSGASIANSGANNSNLFNYQPSMLMGLNYQAFPNLTSAVNAISSSTVESFGQTASAGWNNYSASVAAPTSIQPTPCSTAASIGFPLTGQVSALEKTESATSASQESLDERYLDQGVLLLAPETDTMVRTSCGVIQVSANAAALIIAFDGGIAVYNFHDTRHGAVVINSLGHKLIVAPGRNAVLTSRNVHYYEEVNPAGFVGYRGLVSKMHTDGVKTFQSEFDVAAMLRGVQPLKQLVCSSQTQDRKVANSILKTAAILNSIGGSAPYEYMTAPSVTALHQANQKN